MVKKVSLVLSGGAARGIAHIGVIEELLRLGYEITSITGTSMGALVGAAYSVNKLDALKAELIAFEKKDILNILDITIGGQGIIKGDKLRKRMLEFIPETQIENMPIPFAAVAVDVISQQEIVFRSGSMYDAIRASISIPAIFNPVTMGDKLLVDGGVMNNIPIKYANKKDNEILIAVNVNANIPLKKPITSVVPVKKKHHEKSSEIISYLEDKLAEINDKLSKINPLHEFTKTKHPNIINQTVEIMANQIDCLILEKYPPDILIKISKYYCELYDFFNAEKIIEIGRCVTREHFDKME